MQTAALRISRRAIPLTAVPVAVSLATLPMTMLVLDGACANVLKLVRGDEIRVLLLKMAHASRLQGADVGFLAFDMDGLPTRFLGSGRRLQVLGHYFHSHDIVDILLS